MTNKELQEHLKHYPDDAIISIEYCNCHYVWYDEKKNLLCIE